MRKRRKTPLTYTSVGVNYEAMDSLKRLAQIQARKTAVNLRHFGMKEIKASRGESAYVWEEPGSYRAFVIEGLGTKNLVADETRKITGKTYYDKIAQDTVAMIVNDIIVVGAQPQVINAYFAAGSPEWFSDEKRIGDLVKGWAKACHLAGAVWGGGETPTLKGIIKPETIDLAGSCIGIIKPKARLTLGEKLRVGDRIILVESNGIHANGLTLARKVADLLPKSYATKLKNGKMYGEVLLKPTHIYAKFIQDLFKAKVEIHYMVNITGHGWRKLMRAERNFTFMIENLPKVPEEILLIQKISGNDDQEMYGSFNMGAGLAIYMPEKNVRKVTSVAKKHNLRILNAGYVEKGAKRVVIKPKNIVFEQKTLNVR